MKAALCALIVLVTFSCQAETATSENITFTLFMHTFKYLKSLTSEAKNNSIPFHSPTSDIQECCSKAALECFSSQLLRLKISAHKDLQTKLYRNLNKTIIVNRVDTCTHEQKKNITCQDCDTYPKVGSEEFLINLQTLLQKAFSRLP